MPTYNYKCLSCDKKIVIFQKMSDSPISNCKFCNGQLEKIIGAGSGLIFKGSGFYLTDYKSKAKSKASDNNQSKSNK
tara:strand:+ start:461 stop:691 length:231 start_codon:yes stop_codon:yes gene_type:complete